MRTYTVLMNVTLSIDEQVVERARKKADALGKSLNQLIRDYLQKLAGGDDPERSIEEFNRLSGRGPALPLACCRIDATNDTNVFNGGGPRWPRSSTAVSAWRSRG